MKLVKNILAIVPIFAFSACMVAPEYENPNQSIGEKEVLNFEKFSHDKGQWKTATPQDTLSRGQWYDVFKDPVLSEYMQSCKDDNPDIMSLYYKVQQAAEAAAITRSHLYPNASGSAYYFKNEVGDHSIVRPLGNAFEDWALGATLTWDADLFGRIRSILAASKAEAQSALMEYENALLSLQTKVAALYFSIAEMQSEIAVLKSTLKLRESQTKFVASRCEMQSASPADLERAKALQFSTAAQLTQLMESVDIAKNTMAALLGKTPSAIKIKVAPLKNNPPDIPLEVPSKLLERRADIAAAERMVFAANRRIGAANAAFFPTISITSSLGTESTAFSKLLNTSSFAWGVSPQIYIPLFQAGKLKAQKRAALAKHQAALQDYKSKVLNAVKECENALAKSSHTKQRSKQLLLAYNAANKADKITQEQYEAGVIDYFQACQSHAAALSAKLALLENRGKEYRNAVELIRALGGSWEFKAPEKSALENAQDIFEQSK